MFSNKYRWIMFFISTLYFFYEFILRVSPGVMTSQLREAFHINARELGLMSSVFFQAYAWMQIPVGMIYDRFSTKKVLSIFCFLCGVGAIIFANTTSFEYAIIGRFIMGIGASFGFVGSLKIAEQWLPPKHFSFISGFLFTFGFLGAVISNNVLAAALKYQSWSTSFQYIGYIGIALSILIFLAIYDSPTLAQTQNHLTFKKLVQGLKNVLVNPFIWLNGLIGFLIYFPTSAFAELWGKSYLQTVLHFDAKQAVFAATTVFIGWAAGSPLMGFIADRLDNRKLILSFGSIAAAICISVVLFAPYFNFYTVCLLLFLFGLFSGAQILNFAYALEVSAKEFSSTAIAITNMIVILAGAFSQPIIGYFLDLYWSNELNAEGIRIYSASNFQHAFIILPFTLVISCILSLALKTVPKSKDDIHV